MKATAFAALVLVAIGTLRIVSTYPVFNHTIDEPDHLAAGMEYLHTGKYRYEDQHPPLARLFGALGPSLAGEQWRSGPNSYLEGYRILGHGRHYDRILALGRAGILPFFWIASLVVYLWGLRAGGPAAALGGTLVFTTLPPILAHAGLITTDMALACWTGAAGLVSLYWADLPNRNRSLVFGAVLGLACLSKFSALVFLPAAWVAMYVLSRVGQTIAFCGLSSSKQPARQGRKNTPAAYGAEAGNGTGPEKRRDESRRGRHECPRHGVFHGVPRAGGPSQQTTKNDRLSHWRAAAVVLAVSFLVVWAGYGFSFARVEFLHLRLPAPRFFSGLHSVWQHNRAGHPSYLLGRRSPNGFWYYFPVVLAIKTPLAMLVLLIGALWVQLRKAALPLAFSAGILLCALAGRIDIGVRHILPVYVGLAVGCGLVVAWAWDAGGSRGGLAKAAVLALLAWHAISGAGQHPDYLAYTNEIPGGHPERFVADSDLDWGQDMKRLGEYLAQAGAARVTFSPFNRTYVLAGDPMVEMAPSDPERPSPGWNAVSVTMWKVFAFPAWAGRVAPQKRIGRSILVWYFTE